MTEKRDTSGVLGFGRRLRRAREQLGLSVEDVASELRLSNFQIQALEDDDWETLPGTTYARGYLRSYARLLGLDADQLLAGASTQEIEISRTEPQIEARKAPEAPPRDRSVRFPWAWVGALVIVGVLVAGYWQYLEGWPLLPDGERLRTAETDSADKAQPGGAGPQSEAERAQALGGGAPAEVASDGPPMPMVPQRVVFQFDARSWIDVRDARGQRLLYRSFRPGRRIQVEGQPPFSVFLGNAHAVRVEYMGDTLTPDATSGRIYARFVLGPPSG